MNGTHASRRILPELLLFYFGFLVFWTLTVIVVWKFDALPEATRPWFRTAVWTGAAAIWLAWRRPQTPMTWLGLWPISAKQALLAIMGFAIIFGWQIFRVHFLMTPLNQLASATLLQIFYSFVGVFVEELLFRGVIQTQIAECASALTSILGNTTLFFLIHIPGWIILSIPITAIGIATVILVGLICSVLRYKSGSLWPGTGVHWANNLGYML
jgi:membrane protease YdiL (CAAX protease family)